MINSLIYNFNNNLDEIINKSQLPPVMAYYILQNKLFQLELICKEILQQEQMSQSVSEEATDIEEEKEATGQD